MAGPLWSEDQEELDRLLLKQLTTFDRRNEARTFYANATNNVHFLNFAIDAYMIADVIMTYLAHTRPELNGGDNEALETFFAVWAIIDREQHEATELVSQMPDYVAQAIYQVGYWNMKLEEVNKELDAWVAEKLTDEGSE